VELLFKSSVRVKLYSLLLGGTTGLATANCLGIGALSNGVFGTLGLKSDFSCFSVSGLSAAGKPCLVMAGLIFRSSDFCFNKGSTILPYAVKKITDVIKLSGTIEYWAENVPNRELDPLMGSVTALCVTK